jgi:CMP-2-keto-3-deoxyoctulosonic acid synthetase
LRVLWHGFAMRVAVFNHPPEPGVDSAEDLVRVQRRFTPNL